MPLLANLVYAALVTCDRSSLKVILALADWRLCRRRVKPYDGAAAPLGVSLRSSLSLPLALPVGGVRGPPLVGDMACWVLL